MTVFLVAGHLDDFSKNYLKSLSKHNIFVGIDYGAYFLVKEKIPVSLAVGDFDSLSDTEKKLVKETAQKVKSLPREKDDTDTQAALELAISFYPEENYVILGGIGGRLDHFLANLYLPLEKRFSPYAEKISFRNRQNAVSFYHPGKHLLKKIPEMTYLGYVALTPVKNLTLEKSRYLLENVDVSYPTSYPSNEFLSDTCEFSFASGVVAVIQSRD